MASLASIANKLDELVKQKADAEPKEPSQEEKDEERMRELEAKIADLVEVLSSGTTRESADHSVSDAKDRVQTTQDEERPFLRVYHDHGGKRIPTTRRTQSKMQLADALRQRIRVGKHAQDLEHGLHILVREQVEILERQLGRTGKKGAGD